jgi:RNA polymerase sigma factor (sigma-70 family)
VSRTRPGRSGAPSTSAPFWADVQRFARTFIRYRWTDHAAMDHDDAEQQLLERLLPLLEAYDPDSGVPFWGYVAQRAHWILADLRRLNYTRNLGRGRRGQVTLRMTSLAELGLDDADTEYSLAAPDTLGDFDPVLRDQVIAAVRRLPPFERSVVDLVYYQGVSQAEVSRLFGISETRVGQILAAAYARLRISMSNA